MIALTAYAMPGDRGKCLEAGMDDCLAKPFKMEQLADKVREWTKGGGMGQADLKSETPGQGSLSEAGNGRTREDYSPPVDPDTIEELRMIERRSGKKFFISSVIKFIDNGRNYIREMESAIKDGDIEKLRFSAHTMKGSSGFMGADSLSSLCLDMEQIARSGKLDGAKASLDKIKKEYERVRTFLEQILGEEGAESRPTP